MKNKKLSKLTSISYSELGAKERFDIQEWVESDPSILGEDLMIIAKELPLPSKKRLDLLAIDKQGNLVIIELKRDNSGSDVEWQSIKYASYFSVFSDEQIIQTYANYSDLSFDEASQEIEEFLELEDDWKTALNNQQRIILAAGKFHSDVVSAVLWLREYRLDISCVELAPFVDDKQVFVQPTIIIPTKEAREFVQKWDLKRQEDRIREQQRANSFSLEVADFDEKTLEEELTYSLTRKSNLTNRLIAFLKILLSEQKAFDREEIKEKFYQQKIGNDIGHAGRLLSNVSQFLTKESNPHLRQLIDFSGGDFFGATKSDYYLNDEYRDLVKRVLDKL